MHATERFSLTTISLSGSLFMLVTDTKMKTIECLCWEKITSVQRESMFSRCFSIINNNNSFRRITMKWPLIFLVFQAHAQREESYCSLMKHRQTLNDEKQLLRHYAKENQRLQAIGQISDSLTAWNLRIVASCLLENVPQNMLSDVVNFECAFWLCKNFETSELEKLLFFFDRVLIVLSMLMKKRLTN